MAKRQQPPQIVKFAKQRRKTSSGISESMLNDPLSDLFNGAEDAENLREEADDKQRRRAVDPWEAEEVTGTEEVEVGHPHLLKTPELALKFMMAGNAIVTFRSKAKDNRFTYRIRASEDGGVHFVAVLRGADNNSDYSYLGYIRRDVFLYGGAKAKVAVDAVSSLRRYRGCGGSCSKERHEQD